MNFTLYFGSPGKLAIKNGLLDWQPADANTNKQFVLDEINYLEIDHPQIVITPTVISELATNGVAVCICNKRHEPNAILQPLVGHSLQGKIIKAQYENQAKKSGIVWQQIIKSKIKNQADCLKYCNKDDKRLRFLEKKVLVGDSNYCESQAAKTYFPLLFGENFFRDSESDGINSMLNYGYAIIRSNMVRSIVSAGLYPGIGVFHQNQYNTFALADDLMEPYRPIFDYYLIKCLTDGTISDLNITKSNKQILLAFLTTDAKIAKQLHPVHECIKITAISLAQFFQNITKQMVVPLLCR